MPIYSKRKWRITRLKNKARELLLEIRKHQNGDSGVALLYYMESPNLTKKKLEFDSIMDELVNLDDNPPAFRYFPKETK